MKIQVACVQMQTRIYESEDSFQLDIYKLTERAHKLGCALIVFPEGAGAMLSPQFMPKALVKVLAAAYNENAGASAFVSGGKRILGRFVDRVTATQDLAATFNETLAEKGTELRDSYIRVFSNAARKFNINIVAGSNYGPDETTGNIVNSAYVFGPDGEVLGYQNKLHLYIEDTHICVPGEQIKVFETSFGKIGVLICYEGMFPEVSRVMAAKGAKALINVSACPGKTCFSKIRAGTWSRVQDNLVFGLHSCLVGRNDLSKQFTQPYCGLSSIMAPIEYTEDLIGILTEATDLNECSFLFAEWDFDRLDALRRTTDTPVNCDLRFDLILNEYNQLKDSVAMRKYSS